MTRTKFACAIAAVGLGGALAAGCGGGVPANSVAKVGDTTITKKEFEKWLNAAARSANPGGDPITYDAPQFARCAAEKAKQPQPKGSAKPTSAQLTRQCRTEYRQLKSEVMQFLIQAQWVQQEAKRQDIKLTDAEVRRTFEDQKKQAFPNENAYQKYLSSSGMNEADILFRIRLQALQDKLTQKITEKESKVSDAAVHAYYDKNRRRFAQPERRDLRIVLTKTKKRALEAKAALRHHRSWKQVVKRYSVDPASKAAEGRLPDVTKGQQERALDKAVFAAKKGKVAGPVKTQFGYYLFEVERIRPASQQSFTEAQDTIRNLLRSQRQQKAIDDFIKKFREEYRDKTDCAKEFRIAECKNGPKGSQATGPASGGAPQGGPTGGAPQAGGGSQQSVPAPQQPSP